MLHIAVGKGDIFHKNTLMMERHITKHRLTEAAGKDPFFQGKNLPIAFLRKAVEKFLINWLCKARIHKA